MTSLKNQKKQVKHVESSIAMLSCGSCGKNFFRYRFGKFNICPSCGMYQRITPDDVFGWLCDEYSIIPDTPTAKLNNTLDLKSYRKKWFYLKNTCHVDESISIATCHIDGLKCDIGVFDTNFMMGSIGQTCGNRLERLFNHATLKNLPVILVVASGGARMQEGIISLMQLQKVSNAIYRHGSSGHLYISILTDPTMGGATASFGMQADIVMSERQSQVGFAGKKVILNTIRENISDDLQRSETLMKNGFLDLIVEREDERQAISKLLLLHGVKRVENYE